MLLVGAASVVFAAVAPEVVVAALVAVAVALEPKAVHSSFTNPP